MNREQIVEKLAKMAIQIIDEDDCATRDNIYQCQKCKYSDISFPNCQFWMLADKLVEDNYREIPKGAVVLTKEEYEDMQVRMAYLQEELWKLLKGDNVSVSSREYGKLLYANENVRKETARWILQTLNGILNVAGEINKNHLSAIAKDFSVENEIGVEVK